MRRRPAAARAAASPRRTPTCDPIPSFRRCAGAGASLRRPEPDRAAAGAPAGPLPKGDTCVDGRVRRWRVPRAGTGASGRSPLGGGGCERNFRSCVHRPDRVGRGSPIVVRRRADRALTWADAVRYTPDWGIGHSSPCLLSSHPYPLQAHPQPSATPRLAGCERRIHATSQKRRTAIRGGPYRDLAVSGIGAATAPLALAQQPGGNPEEVGSWSAPFEEGGAETPRCDYVDNFSPNDDRQRLECKPTAVTTAVLPDGRYLYGNGIEGEENAEEGAALSLSPESEDSRTRVLDVRDGSPTGTRRRRSTRVAPTTSSSRVGPATPASPSTPWASRAFRGVRVTVSSATWSASSASPRPSPPVRRTTSTATTPTCSAATSASWPTAAR